VLERAVAAPDDDRQTPAILGADSDADCLDHGPRPASLSRPVNPSSPSVH
jgi:hypothetical protein